MPDNLYAYVAASQQTSLVRFEQCYGLVVHSNKPQTLIILRVGTFTMKSVQILNLYEEFNNRFILPSHY